MAVDENAMIKLHKSEKSNIEIAKRLDMNRSTVWKIVKKFQEHPRPTRARKKTECPLPSTPQNHEEKAEAKPSPSCKTLAIAAGVSKSTMHKVLRDDLGWKLLLHRQELTASHVRKFSRRWSTPRCQTSCP